MVGNRRERFTRARSDSPPSGRSAKNFPNIDDGAVQKGKRGRSISGGRGGFPQGLGSGRGQEARGGFQDGGGGRDHSPPRAKGSGHNPTEITGGLFPRRRTPQRPTNPHDPRSKDPFMRAGMGLGTNDTKIFRRAGMSMDAKRIRKMFG